MTVDTDVRQQGIKKLEDCLLRFYPDEYIVDLVKSTKDIYERRFTLGGINYTDLSFKHLLYIVTDAVENKQRFRKYPCIKLLRDILQTNENIDLDKDILDKLFYLFQEFIFSSDPEIRRHANNLIRNRLLTDEQTVWLIENYNRSLHIINRLLRYPQPNKRVAKWAEEIYERGELLDRTAEILSILMTDNLPNIHLDEDVNTVLWAIYYSRNTNKVKRDLLLSVINENNLHQCVDNIISIAVRIDCGSLVKDLVKKYR